MSVTVSGSDSSWLPSGLLIVLPCFDRCYMLHAYRCCYRDAVTTCCRLLSPHMSYRTYSMLLGQHSRSSINSVDLQLLAAWYCVRSFWQLGLQDRPHLSVWTCQTVFVSVKSSTKFSCQQWWYTLYSDPVYKCQPGCPTTLAPC